MTYAEQFSDANFAAHYQTVSALYYELAAKATARFDDVEAGSRQRFAASLAKDGRANLYSHLGMRLDEQLDDGYGADEA